MIVRSELGHLPAQPCAAVSCAEGSPCADHYGALVSPALKNLICDLPELAPFVVALDRDADAGNPHAASLRGAIVWIQQRAERDERSVDEKLAAIVKLL